MVATTDDVPTEDLSQFKLRTRATWAAGDYPTVARRIWDVGERIVKRVAVRAGEDVLDVACGNGNAAIRAAVGGGRVTGVDITPELFDAGRVAAAGVGVDVTWREGDAEALPFDDGRFDVVLSTFGCMFAPRHDVTAREIVRVLRPAGRLGLCNWTPDGVVGGMFKVVGEHVPVLPSYASPPPLWGDPDHVRRLFEGSGIDVDFDREVIELCFDSVPEMLTFYTTAFGPFVKARELLEPQGRWTALRDDLHSYFEQSTVARDDGIVWPAEYLVVLGRRRLSS